MADSDAMMGENLGGISGAVQGIPFLNLVFGPMVQAMEADARNARLRQMMQEFSDLQTPQFDKAGWTPTISNQKEYQNPILALAEKIQIDPQMREKQMAALNQMDDMSNGYGAAQAEATRRQAIMEANQMAKARSDAASMNASMRGVGGSGLDYALQAQSSQDAANRAMMGGLQGAQQAAQQKYMGNIAYQQGLGNLRNQDTDLASKNSSIANQFNLYNTGLQNQIQNANTQVGNSNIMNNQNLTNQARQYNLGRGDDNQKALFNAAMQKLMGKYGVTKDMVGLSERQSQRDTEKGKEYRTQWNSIMAGGMGGDVDGGKVGTGSSPQGYSDYGSMNTNMSQQMPDYTKMSQADFDKWLTGGR